MFWPKVTSQLHLACQFTSSPTGVCGQDNGKGKGDEAEATWSHHEWEEDPGLHLFPIHRQTGIRFQGQS